MKSSIVSQLEPEIQNYILAVKKIINEPSNEAVKKPRYVSI
jgi:hypothetical protein